MKTSDSTLNPPFSRRSFLRQTSAVTAAAFAAPLIVPSSVFGADGTVAPSNRITIGFIGTGRQCVYANIPGFLREPDAQCIAVCDVDSWRMAKAKKQIEDFYAKPQASGNFKGCAAFRDWRELIARKDIDAVMISTPDHWHVVQAVAALRAGKDVACEKPLTRSIAEGRALADLVLKERRVFRTDSEFRSNRACHRAAQLVRNGKIGKLQRLITGTPKDSTLGPQPEMPVPAELDYDMWLGPAPLKPYTEKRVHPPHEDKGRPGWLCIRDYADGMLANWGAHLNDIALWAADLEHTGPVEIEATGKYPPKGNLWDIVQEFEAHFTFANSVRLTCKTEKPYMRFEGTEGWIQVVYPNDIDASAESLLAWKPGPNDLTLPFKHSEKRDFLDAVKSRQQPLYTAEGGHRNASLSHLALASIEVGRKLKWDPAKEIVFNDDAANQALQPKPLRAPWRI
ncbi:MAG: Gfo/Idh/MocA family oxidoreductase [Verrucomicrobia bacterium]|nr:Gfo/Idh/MocA family oxidoreductase [Verrucomicrobiota bacterium]